VVRKKDKIGKQEFTRLKIMSPGHFLISVEEALL